MATADKSSDPEAVSAFANFLLSPASRSSSLIEDYTKVSRALCTLDNQNLKGIMDLYYTLSKYRRFFDFDSRLTSSSSDECYKNYLLLIEALQCLSERKVDHDATNGLIKELLLILGACNVQALLRAYYEVINCSFEPSLPEVPSEVDEDEGLDIRIVRLIKNDEPLGATIKLDERTGNLLIARIMHGGVADRSGCISVGDRVVEVNGVDVTGKQPSDVVHLLNSSINFVVFKLIPKSPKFCDSPDSGPIKRHVRAACDYDPSQDPTNPCPEASLAFNCGDILRIFDSSDPNWWQARLIDNPCFSTASRSDAAVGLIPSARKFELAGSENAVKNLSRPPAASPYEDVGLLASTLSCRALPVVVLLGAPGVGRDELKRRLLALNANRFACAVPHTSRAARFNETHGVEYFFASKLNMLAWAEENRFVEYGEYRGNLYGTLIDSVEQVAYEQKRQCILTPYAHALKVLRNARLKPIVIFIKAPSLDILKQTRRLDCTRSPTNDLSQGHVFSKEELDLMVKESRRLERHFGQFFDAVVVNDYLDSSFERLLNIIVSFDAKPRWVPIEWI